MISMSGSVKQVPLTQGQFAIVDASDYERIMGLKWQATFQRKGGRWYARHSIFGKPPIMMHRFILDAPTGFMVDHRDGNGLNNCRSNLRLATHCQNMCNRKRHCNNTSGSSGIYFEDGRWRVRLWVNNKSISLGSFGDKESAIAVRNSSLLKYRGEFARI